MGNVVWIFCVNILYYFSNKPLHHHPFPLWMVFWFCRLPPKERILFGYSCVCKYFEFHSSISPSQCKHIESTAWCVTYWIWNIYGVFCNDIEWISFLCNVVLLHSSSVDFCSVYYVVFLCICLHFPLPSLCFENMKISVKMLLKS